MGKNLVLLSNLKVNVTTIFSTKFFQNVLMALLRNVSWMGIHITTQTSVWVKLLSHPSTTVTNAKLLKNHSKFSVSNQKTLTVSTDFLLVSCTSVKSNSKRNNVKNKVKLMELKMLTKLLTSSVSTLLTILNTFVPHVSRSVPNTSPKVKPQNKSSTVVVLSSRVSSKDFSTGSPRTVTKLSLLALHVLSTSVASILPVSKFSVSTPSNNCALTSPTKNSNNFSTTSCSFLNKKNTRKKVSNGPLSISVWTWLLVSNLSKNHSVSSPSSRKNVCSQKLPTRPTEKNFSEPISVKPHLSVNNLPNPKVNVM